MSLAAYTTETTYQPIDWKGVEGVLSGSSGSSLMVNDGNVDTTTGSFVVDNAILGQTFIKDGGWRGIDSINFGPNTANYYLTVDSKGESKFLSISNVTKTGTTTDNGISKFTSNGDITSSTITIGSQNMTVTSVESKQYNVTLGTGIVTSSAAGDFSITVASDGVRLKDDANPSSFVTIAEDNLVTASSTGSSLAKIQGSGTLTSDRVMTMTSTSTAAIRLTDYPIENTVLHSDSTGAGFWSTYAIHSEIKHAATAVTLGQSFHVDVDGKANITANGVQLTNLNLTTNMLVSKLNDPFVLIDGTDLYISGVANGAIGSAIQYQPIMHKIDISGTPSASAAFVAAPIAGDAKAHIEDKTVMTLIGTTLYVHSIGHVRDSTHSKPHICIGEFDVTTATPVEQKLTYTSNNNLNLNGLGADITKTATNVYVIVVPMGSTSRGNFYGTGDESWTLDTTVDIVTSLLSCVDKQLRCDGVSYYTFPSTFIQHSRNFIRNDGTNFNNVTSSINDVVSFDLNITKVADEPYIMSDNFGGFFVKVFSSDAYIFMYSVRLSDERRYQWKYFKGIRIGDSPSSDTSLNLDFYEFGWDLVSKPYDDDTFMVCPWRHRLTGELVFSVFDFSDETWVDHLSLGKDWSSWSVVSARSNDSTTQLNQWIFCNGTSAYTTTFTLTTEGRIQYQAADTSNELLASTINSSKVLVRTTGTITSSSLETGQFYSAADDGTLTKQNWRGNLKGSLHSRAKLAFAKSSTQLQLM